MGEMVELIIDGGRRPARLESTVVDITRDEPEILRVGAVTAEELEEALGQALRVRA